MEWITQPNSSKSAYVAVSDGDDDEYDDDQYDHQYDDDQYDYEDNHVHHHQHDDDVDHHNKGSMEAS